MIRRVIKAASALAAWALISLVRAYQVTLSPYLGRQCRFVPTCSHYFIEAVRRHGPIRGTGMGILRLLRCHPFCKGGYDPVPLDCPGPHPPGRGVVRKVEYTDLDA